jgi:hypothetical protein
MNLLFDARFEMVQSLRRPAEDNQATATRYLEYWLRRVSRRPSQSLNCSSAGQESIGYVGATDDTCTRGAG